MLERRCRRTQCPEVFLRHPRTVRRHLFQHALDHP
jgi:hypothetical protein